MHFNELETMNLEDLHRIARERDLKGTAGMKKKDLIFLILKSEAE
ncbi:MAG: transcription termination factor Rho, partial [Firmicutes bacterium]|nr:transcription termination factor Rho [Bacillota bacterium]